MNIILLIVILALTLLLVVFHIRKHLNTKDKRKNGIINIMFETLVLVVKVLIITLFLTFLNLIV